MFKNYRIIGVIIIFAFIISPFLALMSGYPGAWVGALPFSVIAVIVGLSYLWIGRKVKPVNASLTISLWIMLLSSIGWVVLSQTLPLFVRMGIMGDGLVSVLVGVFRMVLTPLLGVWIITYFLGMILYFFKKESVVGSV